MLVSNTSKLFHGGSKCPLGGHTVSLSARAIVVAQLPFDAVLCCARVTTTLHTFKQMPLQDDPLVIKDRRKDYTSVRLL